jgi:2'-5' RNA ligase
MNIFVDTKIFNSMKSFIKERLRTALINEMEGKKYDYGCVMLYLDVEPKIWRGIQDLIDDEDVYSENGYGRETAIHITLLYGLHSDVPDEQIEDAISKMSSPEVTLKKITTFNNKEYDVVKFDVEGDELYKMNEMLKEFPYTSDFPDFSPHSTICYVKSGKGKKYHKTLSDDEAIVITPNKVVYSKADGTKKEYPFIKK